MIGISELFLRKKQRPLNTEIFPSIDDVQHTKTRLQQKGWIEYLISGGGILRPFSRIQQINIEKKLNKSLSPRRLLDEL